MNRTPQLIITLAPDGGLVIELPGSGKRRQVRSRDSDFATSCRRMLEAQALDRTEIGLDGAPTQAQVRHWERHQIWPSGQCRFCHAEGRSRPDQGAGLRRPKKVLVSECHGVEVRRITSGVSGLGTQRAKKNPEEMGL